MTTIDDLIANAYNEGRIACEKWLKDGYDYNNDVPSNPYLNDEELNNNFTEGFMEEITQSTDVCPKCGNDCYRIAAYLDCRTREILEEDGAVCCDDITPISLEDWVIEKWYKN